MMPYSRFYTENIIILFLDREARLTGRKVIQKSQYGDNLAFLSYHAFVHDGALHVIYNGNVRGHEWLTSEAITGNQEIIHDPLLHDLDRSHKFMPYFARQIGTSELLVPCMSRGSVCLALVGY